MECQYFSKLWGGKEKERVGAVWVALVGRNCALWRETQTHKHWKIMTLRVWTPKDTSTCQNKHASTHTQKHKGTTTIEPNNITIASLMRKTFDPLTYFAIQTMRSKYVGEIWQFCFEMCWSGLMLKHVGRTCFAFHTLIEMSWVALCVSAPKKQKLTF